VVKLKTLRQAWQKYLIFPPGTAKTEFSKEAPDPIGTEKKLQDGICCLLESIRAQKRIKVFPMMNVPAISMTLLGAFCFFD
jgi:hypothetical protein